MRCNDAEHVFFIIFYPNHCVQPLTLALVGPCAIARLTPSFCFSCERVGRPGAGAVGSRIDGGTGARHVRAKPLPLWCRRHGGGWPARRRANTDHCTRKYLPIVLTSWKWHLSHRRPRLEFDGYLLLERALSESAITKLEFRSHVSSALSEATKFLRQRQIFVIFNDVS